MSTHFKRILYGGDYNRISGRRISGRKICAFLRMHINTATINVFSWAKIQPSEHEYYFDELDEIVDMLSKRKITISYLPLPRQPFRDGWCVNIRK